MKPLSKSVWMILLISFAWGQQRPPVVWIQAGHGGNVDALEFTPDGQMLISGSKDTTLKFWRVSDGELVQTLRGHAINVSAIAFSPDRQHFATAGFDGFARVRQLSRCDPLLELPIVEWVFDIAYSPDGSKLVSVNKLGDVTLWDLATGFPIWSGTQDRDRFNTWAMSVAYSPDGTIIASGGQFPRINIWDAQTGAKLQSLAGHSASILCLAFSPNGQTLVSGSGDTTLKVWRRDAGGNWVEVRTLTGHTGSVDEVRFLSDGQRIVSCSVDGTIKLWDLATGSVLRTFEGHSAGVSGLALSPNEQLIASGDGEGEIKLWNLADGTEIRSLCKLSAPVAAVAYSPDGQRVASGEGYPDHTLRMWDARTGAFLWELTSPDENSALAFSPDSTVLAVGSVDDTIRIRRASDGGLIRTLLGHTGNVLSLEWVSNQSLASCAGHPDNKIKVWDVASGRVIRTLAGHTADVFDLAVSPDAQLIASGSMDRTVKLWRLSDGALLWSTPAGEPGHTFWVTAVDFSPDGSLVVSGGLDSQVKLWRTTDGSLVRTLTGFLGGVEALDFSPDGGWLIVGAGFRLYLYRTSDWSLIYTYDQETGNQVSSLLCSPDSRYFLYGRVDSAIVLARIPPATPIRGDVNADGCVNDADLSAVLLAFGREGCAQAEDLTRNGVVEDSDLAEVLLHFGEGC